ncbi:MAG: carbohydrate binding family 9 domain-containing protein, partial [Bacteroidales bacterium]|nr:carbohydrate binding family 9 domain-containing protein [Bacteroidales bacterium]
MKPFLSILLVTALVTLNAFGQDITKRKYQTVMIEKAPVIDGYLSDEAWTSGEWQGDFTQFEPTEGANPSQPTEFKILYDNSYIYVAIKAYDSSPDSIVSRMTRRDNIDGDNVGIVFDSYYDQRTGFAFIVSSAGVKTDQVFANDGQSEDPTWDPIWFAKTSIFEGGWIAEMKIPLTQLRFKSESGDLWGVEVMRQIYRHREMSMWQPIPRNASGLIHMFGLLEGLGGIKSVKQADITPYVVGSHERYQGEAGNPFAKGSDFRASAGVDGKLGITNNLTLDFTILPDFGQVEADPSEVNLTAYETFFQERRPFFIEGRNITSFGVGIGDGDLGNDNLFYSRRIGRRPQLYPTTAEGEYANIPRQVRMLGAVKMTGKTSNGLSIGIVEAVTAEEKAEIDIDGERRFETVEPMANYFVSRLQKDFNKGNTIVGGVFTNTFRNFDESEITTMHKMANTGGIDFTQCFNDRKWMLTSTVAVSNVSGPAQAIAATQRSSVHYFQRPDADYVEYDPTRTSLSGHAGNVQFGKVGGNWNFVVFGIWKSPGFESNDLGYVRKSDEIGQLIWSAYRINKPFSIFNNVRFNTNMWNFWDFGGNYTGTGGNFSISSQFKNMWSTSISYNMNANNQVSNTLLRGGPSVRIPGYNLVSWSLSSDSRKKLVANSSFAYRTGNEDFSDFRSLGILLTYRPVNTLSLRINPVYSITKNQLQYVSRQTFGEENRYIMANINQKVLSLSVRVNYNITPDLSIQYWGQPFLAAADYSKFKMITEPDADKLSDRFHIYDGTE